MVQKLPALLSSIISLHLSPNQDGKREGCIEPGPAGEERESAGEEGLKPEPGSGGGFEESLRKKGHPVPQVFILGDADLMMMLMMMIMNGLDLRLNTIFQGAGGSGKITPCF